ncbi:MAG: four helix bundle protein [Verrucomicrobia bacterium]|nr:four helix bundle protein [Verrucomicrobiota bacterium]
MENKGTDIEDRTLEFAARTGKLVDALPESRLGWHIANQLIRYGTSPAPNYSEACAAESKKDFIHKLGIVLKELRETSTWLKLILTSELLPIVSVEKILDECEQLGNIIGNSLITAKQNLRKQQ